MSLLFKATSTLQTSQWPSWTVLVEPHRDCGGGGNRHPPSSSVRLCGNGFFASICLCGNSGFTFTLLSGVVEKLWKIKTLNSSKSCNPPFSRFPIFISKVINKNKFTRCVAQLDERLANNTQKRVLGEDVARRKSSSTHGWMNKCHVKLCRK